MKIYLMVVVFLYSIAIVNAGTIVFNQTASANISGNTLAVELIFSNDGDSAALNIRPRIYVNGKNKVLRTIPKLDAGKNYTYSTSISLGHKVNGEFHIISIVTYDDELGLKSSNSAKMYLNTVPISEHPISLGLNMIYEDDLEKHFSLNLLNSSNNNIPVKLQYIVPDGIAINRLKEIINLGSGAEESLVLILNNENFSDLAEMPLYVSARFDRNNVQHSQIVKVIINPKKNNGMLKKLFSSEEFLIGLGVFFGLVLLMVIITNVRKK